MIAKKILITLAVAFTAVSVIVSVAVWQDNAGAQPPRFEDDRPIFRSPEVPAICTATYGVNHYIFVVKGNTIYKFDADLKLINKARLEEERRFRPDERETPFPPSRKR